MRGSVLLVGIAIALSAASGSSQSIVQNVGGDTKLVTPLILFDPSLGVLDSVELEGTMYLDELLVRTGDFDPSVTESIPRTTTGSLTFDFYDSFYTTSLTGYELYPANSIFGSMYLSAPVSITFTGAGVGDFYAGVVSSVPIETLADVLTPIGAGQIGDTPEEGNSLKVTYNYHNFYVPEPSTWAMMLLGFAIVGLALRSLDFPKTQVNGGCDYAC